MPANPASERTRLRRRAQRGVYEPTEIERILDDALVCHIGFVDAGQPYVLPTVHARLGRHLYLHGALANRMLGLLASGVPACVSATVVDGLVVARAALHHSVNYRSVVVLGRAVQVEDADEKREALHALLERVLPGRSGEARPPSDAELRTTRVVRLPLDEASAKVRVGPPLDEEEDYHLPVWAGELPVRSVVGPPVADPRLRPGAPVPPSVAARTMAV